MFKLFQLQSRAVAQGPVTADTPIAAVLEQLFPKAMVTGGQHGILVRSCRFEHRYRAIARLPKTRSIPASGTVLDQTSTQGLFGRNRWFLIECGEVYVLIRVSPAQKGCGFLEMAQCVGAAIAQDEKSEWRQEFEKRVARLSV